MTNGNPHRETTDRARGEFPLRGQTWEMAMQVARDVRRARAAAAARTAIDQAFRLAGEPAAAETAGDPMWELRGEPRTRATFGQPHPGDFPGGLPLPGDCPQDSLFTFPFSFPSTLRYPAYGYSVGITRDGNT